MICTWLTEIMLHQINSAEGSMRSAKLILDRHLEDATSDDVGEYKKYSSEFTSAVNEFRNFIAIYKV